MRIKIHSSSAFLMGLVRFFSNRFGSPPSPDFKEPVALSLGQIRAAIRQSPGTAEPPATLVGRIFQECFADLLGGSQAGRWQAALEPETLSSRRRLLEHIYDRLLGPRITQHQAALRDHGAEVLKLWRATREMTDWLGALLETFYRDHILTFNRSTQTWSGGEKIAPVDQLLSWTLREPDWTRPVRITGVPEAMWRHPQTGHWCVVEYRLGEASPEADAAQASLYHLMLAHSGRLEPGAATAICMVSFLPEREERLMEGPQLADAQKFLKALIGNLAGVLPGQAQSQSGFLLGEPAPKPEHHALGRSLARTLEQHGPPVEIRGGPIVAPAFLRYTVLPGPGVKLASLATNAEEIRIRLGLDFPPIIQRTANQLLIDVQRPDREMVAWASIQTQLPPASDPGARSKVPLGVDLFRTLQVADLARTPHLLVTGAPGSGKTEWLRSALAALLEANTPETLRLVLIDPKRNAFDELRYSPFLWNATSLVYPPPSCAIEALDRLIAEMENRQRPRIVCVCDEYADLVGDRREKREIEDRIRRLGASGRAAGIHLLIATQFPAPDIVGALKAHLPGRVCFRTATPAESQAVIGQSGAERLLGNGDLFWVDSGEPVRLQAPLLSPEDRVKILGWRTPPLLEAAGTHGAR